MLSCPEWASGDQTTSADVLLDSIPKERGADPAGCTGKDLSPVCWWRVLQCAEGRDPLPGETQAACYKIPLAKETKTLSMTHF